MDIRQSLIHLLFNDIATTDCKDSKIGNSNLSKLFNISNVAFVSTIHVILKEIGCNY